MLKVKGKGGVGILTLPILIGVGILGITLLGFALFKFDELLSIFSNSYFLIGLGAIILVLTWKFFLGPFIMGFLYPILMTILNILRMIFK